MVKKIKRQVRWNRKTEIGEQIRMRHRYTVLIINEPREIERIREKFFEQLSPIDDFNNICDYLIRSSGGLHAVAFSFSSDKGFIEEPDEIYRKPESFYRDRALFEREGYKFERYLESLLS